MRGFFAERQARVGQHARASSRATRACKGSDKADHADQIADYGVDLGGPIVKDKLWFWGSYGKQDMRILRLNQSHDKTLLKDYNAKLNWQATLSDMFSVF